MRSSAPTGTALLIAMYPCGGRSTRLLYTHRFGDIAEHRCYFTRTDATKFLKRTNHDGLPVGVDRFIIIK